MGSNETLLSGKREHMAQRKERFLAALTGSCGDARLACRVAGVSATTVARWKSSDEGFSAASDEVEDAAFLLLEAEARRRAMAGEREASGLLRSRVLMRPRRRAGAVAPVARSLAHSRVTLTPFAGKPEAGEAGSESGSDQARR